MNFLDRQYMSFYMSAMFTRGLFSKIGKIFSVKKLGKSPIFKEKLPFFTEIKGFQNSSAP